MRRLLVALTCLVVTLALTAGTGIADIAHQDNFVPAGASGGIVSDNGQIEWSIPQGTYSGPLLARYIPDILNSVPAPSADSIWVGSPFTLETWDSDLGRLVATDRPMTLTIHYRPEDLGGRSESTLRIVRYYDQWSPFPSMIDTARHTVTTQITYGGDYGLLASNVGTAPVFAPAPAPAQAPAPVPAAPPAPAPAPAPVAPAGSIVSGKVFYDKNGNGQLDGDDFAVGGAGVIISSGDWYAFTRTRADGTYGFGGLSGGSYTVNVVVGPEWAYTTPVSVGGITVSGQSDSAGTANFGIWLKGQ